MKILLIIGGGISAYKCLDLIRRLKRAGHGVTPVLTRAACEFVTPLSVSALAECKARIDLLSTGEEAAMDHIQLSRSADLIVVAPATADLMAKMANGLADDLASTLLLATDTPVMAVPAMNVRMWTHRATQRNIRQLIKDGISIIGPNEGDMACGEYGAGRMSEPEEIEHAIAAQFNGDLFRGKKMIVTSGPTWEPIDPVRVIANRSSGRQGFAIAEAFVRFGAEVTLVSGPTALSPPVGVNVVNVETADEMLAAVERALPADVAVFAAAVADWKVRMCSESKIKKQNGQAPTLRLTENPDILATTAQRVTHRPELVIGFAAETDNVVENARAKLERKKCDWIVANDVSADTGILGGAYNQPVLISAAAIERFPRMSKEKFAEVLVNRIGQYFSE